MARSRSMSRGFLVVGVVIAGCGTAVGSPSASAPAASAPAASGVASMTPPNGASSQPTPPSSELPAALQDTWVSETRSIPGLTPPAVESFMEVTGHQLLFHASEDWTAPMLSSVAAADGATGVRLRLEDDSLGCAAGTEGAYAFELSPSGRALNVGVVADPCAARIAALSGAWTRIDCPDNHNCLGDLDAGPHASVIYTPFVPFADWRYDYGRFTYAVPDGWTNPEDNKDGYVLVPRSGPDGAGIYVFSDVLAHAQAHDPATGYCRAAPEPGVGSSAPQLRDWIRSLPGLAVSHEDHVADRGPDGLLDGPVRRIRAGNAPVGGPARCRACRCS